MSITQKVLHNYFKKSRFSPLKLKLPELWRSFQVEDQIISLEKDFKINSYIAADLAEFIRRQLLKHSLSFSYETVMSDAAKIRFLKKARIAGYRIYLYFFATEDPVININRVKIRVAQKGHKVKPEVVKSRYYRSLENLKSAVEISDRAYLFDNSAEAIVMIAEITNGSDVQIFDSSKVPGWFIRYLVHK